MALNTAIRGQQIREDFAGLGLTISGGVMDADLTYFDNYYVPTTGGTFTGDISILGNLTVTGSGYITHVEDIQVEDNTIILNYGETGSGVTAGTAGIIVDRGTETDYQFIFDESTDTFRIGETGSLQAVATREDSPLDLRVPWWDDATSMFKTAGDTYITVDTTDPSQTIEITVSGSQQMSLSEYGMALASGATVNNIKTTISEPGIDTALVTEKSIVDYVAAEIGSLSGTLSYTGGDGIDITGTTISLESTVAGLGLSYTAGVLDVQVASGIALQDDYIILDSSVAGSGLTYTDGVLSVVGTFSNWETAAANTLTTIDRDSNILIGGGLTVSGTFQFDAAGQAVDTIVTTISGSGLDTELVTSSAVYDFVTAEILTLSGSILHNTLSDLQGGTAGEYYHLTSAQYSDYIGASEVDTISGTLQSQIDNVSTDISNLDTKIDTTSGTLQSEIDNLNHNTSLAGLQGGNGSDEYYHLTANEDAAFYSDGTNFIFSQNILAGGNVTISGTFGFDTGTTVTEISTAMGGSGDDDTLLTEAAIYNFVSDSYFKWCVNIYWWRWY